VQLRVVALRSVFAAVQRPTRRACRQLWDLDNAAAADAIAAKGGEYCGVALVPTTIDDAALGRLDRQGFRGARFNYMHHLGTVFRSGCSDRY
jgi:hypothetical protein